MASINESDYDKLITEQEQLVRDSPTAAIVQLNRIIKSLDTIYFIFLLGSWILFLTSFGLAFRPFQNGAAVMSGIVLMAFSGLIILSAAGIDPHRQEAPEEPDFLRREDFPRLFQLLDSTCDQLQVPRCEKVVFSDDRQINFAPHGLSGRNPTWSIALGTYSLFECSADEFEWEVAFQTACFHGEYMKVFRDIYDRMEKRTVLIRLFPSMAQRYWEAWGIAAALLKVHDQHAFEVASQVADSSWAGSVYCRVFTGPFTSDIALMDLASRLALEHPDVPADYCEMIDSLGLGQIPSQNDLIKNLLKTFPDSSESSLQGMALYMSVGGISPEAIAAGKIQEIAERLAHFEGESAFAKYIGVGTVGSRCLNSYIQKREKYKWQTSREESLMGLRVRSEKGEGTDGLTAEECLAVMSLIGAEKGHIAALEYGEKAMKHFLDDPWICALVAAFVFRLRPMDFPALVPSLREVTAFRPLLKKHIENWSGFFPGHTVVWGDPLLDFDLSKVNEYIESGLPTCWRSAYIAQAKENNHISSIVACRGVDDVGTENIFVVAVFKNRSFTYRPPWFKNYIQNSFRTDVLSTFSVRAHDDPWVAQILKCNPQFEIYRK